MPNGWSAARWRMEKYSRTLNGFSIKKNSSLNWNNIGLMMNTSSVKPREEECDERDVQWMEHLNTPFWETSCLACFICGKKAATTHVKSYGIEVT
jgi:hypothetical protein